MLRQTVTRFVLAVVVLYTAVVIAEGTDIVTGSDSDPQRMKPSVGSPSCPTGSSRDLTSGMCVQICLDGSSSNGSECKTRAKESYDRRPTSETHKSVVRADFTDTVTMRLPGCKEMELSANEFLLLPATDNATTTLQTTFGKVPETFLDYKLSNGNSTATVCYPLSPQLLQCDPLRRLLPDNYIILPNRSLLLSDTNVTVDVRDYHTMEHDIITCNETINPDRKLRCNWINLRPSEYQFLDNLTLWLPATNHTIYRPTFRRPTTEAAGNGSVVFNDTQLCFPLTAAFTLCPKYVILVKNEYEIQDDHRVLNLVHGGSVLDPNEYYLLKDGRPAFCMKTSTKAAGFDVYLIHASMYVVSAVCLLVAFVVHLIVPSLNYHAKPLLCHMLTLLVMFTMLAARKFMKNIQPTACYSLFVVTYLATLSSLFWLNVLSFDLWSIFNNLQTTSRCSFSWCKFNKNKFFVYSIYAWGVPVVLCVLTVILDTHPSWQEALDMYPAIGNMCWFNERKSALVMLYTPLFAVLAVNLTLFSWTVYNLRQASRGVEVVNKKLNRQLLFVCFKLFVVMGLCWILEAAAWSANTGIEYFYAPDFINAIQGIIIFVIYICKPQTLKLLRKRFSDRPESGRWTNVFNTSRGNDTKNSSSGITMNSVIVERDNSLKEKPDSTDKANDTPTQPSPDVKC